MFDKRRLSMYSTMLLLCTTTHRPTTICKMSANAAKIYYMFYVRSFNCLSIIFANISNSSFPICYCKIGWHHCINRICIAKRFCQKSHIFYRTNSGFSAFIRKVFQVCFIATMTVTLWPASNNFSVSGFEIWPAPPVIMYCMFLFIKE